MTKHKAINKNLIYMIVLIVFIALEIGMVLGKPFHEIELFTEDVMYQRASSVPENIKIIAVDEKTLTELGPYNQWDRTNFANLVEKLYEDESASPKVLAFDFIFSSTNESEADKRFANEAGKHDNIICASKLEVESRTEKINGRYYRNNYVSSEMGGYEELAKVTTSGFTTPIFDEDGYTRRAYGAINAGEKEYVSFALQTARLAGFEGEIPSVYEFRYSGNPGDFETIPMSMVLNGTVKGSYFKDAIVLVGAYEEGMMDSFSVPVDHSANMYGVEIQANEITAIMQNKLVKELATPVVVIVSAILIAVVGLIVSKGGLKSGAVVSLISLIGYVIVTLLVFETLSLKMPILYFPLGIILLFISFLIVKYIVNQRERAEEMENMLFSMADAMAEAIEGRTPYNANHTKNVAKRSVELLEFINEKHAQKKTELHFSENDKKQMYLAAMLHDIGKMDVPTGVMDKPTRLGNKRKGLADRLMLIKLHLIVDELKGHKETDFVDKEVSDIDSFLSQLDGFDCGRPLKEAEISFIDDMAKRSYVIADADESKVLPYLTAEELDDLHIKAGTLSDNEREIMKSHVVYTDRILSHMDFGKEFDRVRRMAADHHELMNGKGYPVGKAAEDLDVLTRILTIMDIYDSLIADDRPYKKPKPVPVAFEILDEEAEAGKVDKELLEIAKEMLMEENL